MYCNNNFGYQRIWFGENEHMKHFKNFFFKITNKNASEVSSNVEHNTTL